MDEKRLASIRLFAGLSSSDRARLARIADEVDVPAGKELINEGRFPYEVFLIEEGTADVVRGSQTVAELGPGDVFGETGALTDAVRNATVRARTPMRLVVMSARDFRKVTSDVPHIEGEIRRAMDSRRAPQG